MSHSVAIIGASNNRAKFGNKSVRAFARAGWTVHPVNPRESTIENLPAYSSIAEVPEPLDRVSLYVPAAVGRTLLDAIVAKNPQEVFFNPSSDDPELMTLARQLGLKVVQACSIVDVGFSPSEFPDA